MTEDTFTADTRDAIELAMLEDAQKHFGEDLNTNQLGALRSFYRPVAAQFAQAQQDIGLVLNSSQIDNATGRSLDLIASLVGVSRNLAQRSRGTVTFSRDGPAPSDYVIPQGTVIQTDSLTEPRRFETAETAVLEEGESSVDAAIRSFNGGADLNVGSNTLTIMPNPPTGIEFVSNESPTEGGTNREGDDELRDRAKGELSDGSSSTPDALISQVKRVDGVRSVSIFINDSDVAKNGLPGHSFELVVDGGDEAEIAQTILDNIAAGSSPQSGVNGAGIIESGTLLNGQELDVGFSRPDIVQIYIDADVIVDDEYEGDNAIRDSIIPYVGGTFSSGGNAEGQIETGEDVLYGEIEYAIRSVKGVYDVSNLTIGTDSENLGTNNVPVNSSEVAVADATDGTIVINTTER